MRPDLLALTPQAIASLANVGLVKRAQKELDGGKGPRLEELADGTVVGTFEDGSTARLVPGKGLKDSPCSCGATGACRHRVAVALAYPTFARGGAKAAQDGASPSGTAEAPATPWTPGAVEDEALAKVLPARALERASALRGRGYVAQVRRGASSAGDEPPAVALATCTVRFLVPRDLAYARCDCAAGAGCEHVALAVWAFRAADERDPAAR
ncbi:MAG TPA: hypothetical protein VK420_12610, partial [Longimicrobium sp.]|nr:hypothetical protein [Longimicrobium sp.]